MKMQGFKYALWAINFVIVVGIGLSMTLLVLASDSTVPNVAKDLDAKASQVVSKTGPAESGVNARDIDVLWNVAIRKKPPEPEKPVESESSGATGPTSVTPLDRYIVVAGLLGDAIVVLYVDPKVPSPKTPLPMGAKDPMPKQLVVEIGKPLPDIKPEAVPVRFQWTPFPGAVVFTYDGKEVVIPVARGADTPTAPVAAGGRAGGPFGGPAGQVPGRGRVPGGKDGLGGEEGGEATGEGGEGGAGGETATEAREVRPGTWEIPTSERDHIQQNAREILDQIGVEDYSEGSIQGLKLSSLPGDSLPAQRGFQEGDIIKSVNGTPITSQSDLINYSKKMEKIAVVRVEYYRQGKLMSSTYRVK